MCFASAVNNIDCDNFQLSDEKKDLEDDEDAANGPREILPYSSMFIFGQTNPYVPLGAGYNHPMDCLGSVRNKGDFKGQQGISIII